ncbi:DUF2844 domain-containing protein [Novosphingobium sp.]|uniref:DUF2844 domain-containing protein n=1 Tax=Novosphingobium sp. TaxID=1874826 RepID=UPI003D15090A
MRKLLVTLSAMGGVFALPHAASASLGGTVDTITTDQSKMSVRMHAVARSGAGNLHTLTMANGGEVREYTNAAGTVYAIRWTGPGKPDLDTLLGTHFATMQADNPVIARRGMRRPPGVDRADLKIMSGGHAGAFWGYAWLPLLVPPGFDPSSL